MDPDLAYEAAEGKAAAQPGRTSALPSGAQITELKAERLKLTNRTELTFYSGCWRAIWPLIVLLAAPIFGLL